MPDKSKSPPLVTTTREGRTIVHGGVLYRRNRKFLEELAKTEGGQTSREERIVLPRPSPRR